MKNITGNLLHHLESLTLITQNFTHCLLSDVNVSQFELSIRRSIRCLIQGIGEPPLLTSLSVFFALKEAITAARVDAGLSAHFKLNSPATVSKILLATHSAEL